MESKILAGQRLTMSFARNRTKALWQGFMPRRKEIRNVKGRELYSVEMYDPLFFQTFDPQRTFEKWAAVEVSREGELPEGMETLLLPAGQYAVFIHQGPASEAERTYRYIFETWLPVSGYLLDHRPHFALMGEKYRHDNPHSEEEVWIPVRPKHGV